MMSFGGKLSVRKFCFLLANINNQAKILGHREQILISPGVYTALFKTVELGQLILKKRGKDRKK